MRPTRHLVPLVAAGLGFLLAVAGCASASPGELPAESSMPAEPSPAETPQPARLPAFEDLTITPAGIGSLLIGKPVTDTDMVTFAPNFCHEISPDGVPLDSPLSGQWLANYSTIGEPYSLFVVDVDVDTQLVTAIRVRSAQLKTNQGIRIGSSLDDLVASHSPQAGAVGPLSSNYFITENGNTLVFEVPSDGGPEGNTVGDIRLGLTGGSEAPNFWGTDGGPGCAM